MALNKRQVAFLYDMKFDTDKDVKKFVNIIKKGFKTLDEYQCFHGIEQIQFGDDYLFLLEMLGALKYEKEKETKK